MRTSGAKMSVGLDKTAFLEVVKHTPDFHRIDCEKYPTCSVSEFSKE